MLPGRSDKLTGLLIQPNILERSKDTILPAVARFNETYTTTLANVTPTSSGAYLQYTGRVDGKILTLTAQDDDQLQGYLTSSVASRYGGTIYSHNYRILSGSVYITGSTPYWRSDATQPVILSSSLSEIKQVNLLSPTIYGGYVYGSGIYGSSGSLVFAQVQDYLPAGINNQKYAGSKLNAPDFNIKTIQTVDGGPVVEFNSANPNQLIYQNVSEKGSFKLV